MAAPLLAADSAFRAIGAISQSISTKRVDDCNARVAENRAGVRDRQADDARRRGNIEESRFRAAAGQERGAQAAVLAAQGVDVASGSPLQVLTDQAGLDELDALQIRSNAEQEAYGFEVDSVDLRNQAELNRSQGRAALTGGFLSAGGSLLSNAGRVSSAWYTPTAAPTTG